MSNHSPVDDVVQLLASPELECVAASSPAVRATLQSLLDQVDEEIATLAPLVELHEAAERERLWAGLRGRQEIAARLREMLSVLEDLAL